MGNLSLRPEPVHLPAAMRTVTDVMHTLITSRPSTGVTTYYLLERHGRYILLVGEEHDVRGVSPVLRHLAHALDLSGQPAALFVEMDVSQDTDDIRYLTTNRHLEPPIDTEPSTNLQMMQLFALHTSYTASALRCVPVDVRTDRFKTPFFNGRRISGADVSSMLDILCQDVNHHLADPTLLHELMDACTRLRGIAAQKGEPDLRLIDELWRLGSLAVDIEVLSTMKTHPLELRVFYGGENHAHRLADALQRTSPTPALPEGPYRLRECIQRDTAP